MQKARWTRYGQDYAPAGRVEGMIRVFDTSKYHSPSVPQ
jgi:hypothetical protein